MNDAPTGNEPPDLEEIFFEGTDLHGEGKAEEALACFERCLAIDPDYADALLGKAMVHLGRGEFDEAIACANDNEYGLSAAVFGRDIARAFNVARKIDSGICHVNGPTVHDEAQMPFGGVKGSGMGRFGGKAGIAEFTELRWITVQTGERHYPF